MRSADPKSDSTRVETFSGVTRSSEVFILGFENGEVFVKGIIMWTVDVMGQLERKDA